MEGCVGILCWMKQHVRTLYFLVGYNSFLVEASRQLYLMSYLHFSFYIPIIDQVIVHQDKYHNRTNKYEQCIGFLECFKENCRWQTHHRYILEIAYQLKIKILSCTRYATTECDDLNILYGFCIVDYNLPEQLYENYLD